MNSKLLDIAEEFADLNIFNESTRTTLIGKVGVFCDRSGVTYIEDLSLKALIEFKKTMLATSLPITYNGYIRYLRIVVDYAVSRGLLEKNIFRDIRLAPVGKAPRKTMDRETIKGICKYISAQYHGSDLEDFWLCVVHCLYYTGMRRRQIVTLRLRDINFDERTIFLSYEGSKTHRSWTIPLHKELLIRLQEYIFKTEYVTKRRMHPEDFIFVAKRFNPRFSVTKNGSMRPDTITGFFKRMSKSMGVAVGAHRFRHTFATELCNPVDDAAPDIFAVQTILGHTSIQTTREYVLTSVARMGVTLNKISAPM